MEAQLYLRGYEPYEPAVCHRTVEILQFQLVCALKNGQNSSAKLTLQYENKLAAFLNKIYCNLVFI